MAIFTVVSSTPSPDPWTSPSLNGEKPMSTVYDSELFLRKAFEQEPRKGFELLFRQYYTPLCSHAVRFVYSRQLAEDLVSEVFYQFYRTEAYRKVRSSFISYLFTAVRNEAYTHLRKEFGKTDSIDSTTENHLQGSQPQPDSEVHFNNLYLAVTEAINHLPAQCRRVFLLSRFENKKYDEIAAELQISPRTVEVHISKALKHLRQTLRDEWTLLLCLLNLFFQ
ncbi:RNA polymerase sigma-70 factor [Spirosoma sp. KCTC 42546]|uniref:RNA polymerase sigma factor n=1 Tax=Spirosoma sp. KCTC 42546 TaxID=2520506 RepID=UPI001158F411|nr:RNA polymerase sigma-70 factor [Spirosoma sp. KCTC 42546]QDK81977.1 RNA polymerase sigma-70 factor [Spirosoma sp. KCTC 42546]